MMAKVRGGSSNSAEKPKRRRPIDPEAREMQMAALAMDLVEQRLRDGTASSQETTHFLKLVSSKAILEKKGLEQENKLIEAKTESIHESKEYKTLVEEAIKAMRNYSGQGDPDEY